MLTRDRLLGMYETKPVLQKLRVTLIGSGVILLTSAALLFGIIRAEADEDGMYGRGSARIKRQQVGIDGMYGRGSPGSRGNSSVLTLGVHLTA